MIEVFITKNGEPIAHIEIVNQAGSVTEFADYRIKYAVERGTGVGAHTRTIYGFPRKYYNVFALVLQALNALNEKDLKLERDFDPDEAEAPVPSDLARRLGGTLREIQAGFSRLHHHRPALRSGQQEQHGGDGERQEVRPQDRQ